MGTTYDKYPKPKPEMDAGRSATPVGGPMTGTGQDSVHGSMGKHQKTGDGMENEKGSSGGKSKKMDY